MPRVCRGGALDGMECHGPVDEASCVRNEGVVVDTGGAGGVCGASAASAAVERSQGSLGLMAMRGLRTLTVGNPVIEQVMALNKELGPAIGVAMREPDSELAQDLSSLFVELSQLATGVVEADTDGDFGGFGAKVYTAELHDRVVRTLRRLHDLDPSAELLNAVETTTAVASSYIGRRSADLAHELRNPDTVAYGKSVTGAFSPVTSLPLTVENAQFAPSHHPDSFSTGPGPVFVGRDLLEAARQIDAKAAQLGSLAGPPQGAVQAVPGGWMRSFAGCDIYYSKGNGAFEVHGDIRAKYNAVGGPAALGDPVLDEAGTPDGRGRFNHFGYPASIYWTPSTGPKFVRGRIREIWAAAGWEVGPLGYPVNDEYTLPGLSPQDSPNIAWSMFENGMLLRQGNAVAPALMATLQLEDLKRVVRLMFDRALKQQDQDLGLEANVDVIAISDWQSGFWAAVGRTIAFRLHGFYNNGFLPDSTFELEITLRFRATSSAQSTAPAFKSVVAELAHLNVNADGLGNGTLANGLFDGIYGFFWRGGPDPAHTEVPDGALFLTSFKTGVDQTGAGYIDVMDILTTADGNLNVLVNPLPTSIGKSRQMFAQNVITVFLESF